MATIKTKLTNVFSNQVTLNTILGLYVDDCNIIGDNKFIENLKKEYNIIDKSLEWT
jgi:hypothetical protein